MRDFLLVGYSCLLLILSHYFPMQNVYLPTQTIFVLYKALYINM